jgi:hypothetical protein
MRSDPFLFSFADAVRNFNYRRMRQVMEVESHGSQTVRSGGTQEPFTKLRTEPTLESGSFRGGLIKPKRFVTRLSLGRFRVWSGERDMSLFREKPKEQNIQTGLASVLGVLVLVATVNFYRFLRYFPA